MENMRKTYQQLANHQKPCKKFQNSAQMVRSMVLCETFLMYDKPKGDKPFRGFHNLHHAMFQCVVCLESYKI